MERQWSRPSRYPPIQKMASWQTYDKWKRGEPHTAVGNVQIREKVWSSHLKNYRNLVVYLPPSYKREKEKRYPVLYMQDGQNLFDQSTSFSEEWRVDETMEGLGGEGVEAIIVGVSNTGQRLAEYSPFTDPHHGPGRGDQYLAFLADTAKPLVDREFRTLPGRKHTGIMGSSMGGLISLYAFFRCPHLFSFAGVMSPSLWYANGAIFKFIRRAAYVPGRIYLDVGTRELGGSPQMREALRRSRRYYASVRRLKRLLVKKGYRPSRTLLAVEEQWAGHHEPAWARRLPDALRFLLDNEM